MAASIFLALVLWPLGEVERARQLADAAVALARRSGHVPSLAYAYFHACLIEAIRGDGPRGAPHATALFDLCREHAMPVWSAAGTFLNGWSLAQLGQRESGLAGMHQGLAQFRQLGISVYLPFLGMALADAESQLVEANRGLARIEETLSECERTGQHWLDAELHRLRGDILLRQKPAEPVAAESAYQTALAISERQGTRSFALRAATRLAQFRGVTDRSALLRSALQGFTPTPEFPDIAKAQMLLAESSGKEFG